MDALSGAVRCPAAWCSSIPILAASSRSCAPLGAAATFSLVFGWHKGGGEGCYCAENAVLKLSLALDPIVLQAQDVVISIARPVSNI